MSPATFEDNKGLIRQAFAALNERDQQAFADLHLKDVVLHDHNERSDGVEAAIDHEWTVFEAFPDMKHTLEDLIAENGTVACRWTVTGTHEGAFQGIDPTGKSFSIAASGFFRVQEGKVAEVWLNYDRLGLMKQIGVA